ncbi:alpha/beta hydrolase family protein [Sphingomonas sp.]|uniref:alpha/beta hydrolase family protein n=1 Tax=Sphingomonas sp. TaxID=28214 RepID=UPI002DD61F5C|nr:S9 family peptidase [Sphingomonas sp.]
MRFLKGLASTTAILTLSTAQAQTQAPMSATDAAAAFGARENLQGISLSPDGSKVAMIVAGQGRSAMLMIGDLVAGGAPKTLTRTSGDPDQLNGCDWASTTRLICSVTIRQNVNGQHLSFGRLIAINADGTDMKVVSARDSSRAMGLMQHGGRLIDWGGGDSGGATALVTRQFVPEDSLGTRMAETRQGLGVEMVDTKSLSRRVVEPPRDDAVDYISDGHGTVRVMGMRPPNAQGYDGSRIIYLYRKPGNRGWDRLSEYEVATRNGFNPYAVDRDLNVVYGFDKLNGRLALFKVALDGSLKKELVHAHPQVDVDGLVRVGRHQRVVGVSYATDHRVAEFFDPATKALRDSLSRALTGKSLSVIDASTDESKLLVFAGSDVDPGRYYLFDKAAKRLEEVAAVRPPLGKVTLAAVRPVTYPAADGTTIPGYLTLPPGATSAKGLPAIVMPHGGPEARDEWGFDWLSQFFANRGYAVLQPNFRGSSGYGDAWFQKNGFQSWRTAVGDVNDGGKWLVKQGADPAKLAIFGWSYGGYAALQSPALDPALFKAIVAVAPVTDLDMTREEARGYTHFPQVDAFIGRGAHLRDGSPARNAGTIKAPVLLFHGTRDTNVGHAQSRLMADRIRDVKGQVDYVEFDALDHYLDDAAARTRMLSQSDAFLRKAMGM